MPVRLAKLLVSIIYHILIRPIARLTSAEKPITRVILYYHSIKARDERRFARQIDYLAGSSTVVPLGFTGPFERGARYTMITFDDAYKSAIDYGLPILRERGMPFALFTMPGCLGENPSWLRGTGNMNELERIADAEELRALPSDLVTVGSHTVNHVRITDLCAGEAERELEESKAALESILGRPVDYFAFPYGASDDAAIDACRKAGYKQVFTIEHEAPDAPFDTYARGRVCVEPFDWSLEFRLKAAGSYSWLRRASRLKALLRGR